MNLLCLIGPCRRWAKWVPVLVAPPKPSEDGAGDQLMVLGVVVCDQCRSFTTPATLIGPAQRQHVNAMVRTRGYAPIDWSRAAFRWVDVQSVEVQAVVDPILKRQMAEAIADPSQLH